MGSRRQSARHSARAFTLIELLVALVAGLLVAAAAVSFSKHSTRSFSQEARIASAQMSVLAGFQRLQSDISRASYMAAPNMQRDKDNARVCAPDGIHAAWPATLKTLTGLMVTRAGSQTFVPAPMPDGNYPDSIRIAGSLSSTEVFPVRTVLSNGSGHDVYLQVNTGAMARSGIQNDEQLQDLFKTGRVLRIVDQQRKEEYAVIKTASFQGGQPVIETTNPLPLKGELTAESAVTSVHCGIEGFGVGVQANVVNIIEYGIANLSDHKLYQKTIYSDAAYAYGDDSRTELVRREILLDGDIPELDSDPTAEVIAEYAVDLRFGLWATNPAGGGMTYIAPSTAGIDTRMTLSNSYTPAAAPTGPESVRSVEVRLAVRSREIDRRANIESHPALDGGFMFRYPIPNDAGFSRVRTLVADVTLPNQGGETW